MIFIGICTDRLTAVQAFYEKCGYSGTATPDDTIVAATEGSEIVGAARLCGEEGVLVLRGMYIAETHQRRGVGSRMLIELEKLIGNRAYWGIPFAHLESFYGQIGFRFLDDEREAPLHLIVRIQTYRARNLERRNGRVNKIMFRAPPN